MDPYNQRPAESVKCFLEVLFFKGIPAGLVPPATLCLAAYNTYRSYTLLWPGGYDVPFPSQISARPHLTGGVLFSILLFRIEFVLNQWLDNTE